MNIATRLKLCTSAKLRLQFYEGKQYGFIWGQELGFKRHSVSAYSFFWVAERVRSNFKACIYLFYLSILFLLGPPQMHTKLCL